MASATAAVFETPELLEMPLLATTPEKKDHVLNQSDLKALVTCRRINKTLQDLIDTSPKLQQALLLRPSAPRTAIAPFAWHQWHEGPNPLLVGITYLTIDSGGGGVRVFLSHVDSHPSRLTIMRHRTKPDHSNPARRMSASWERMLLCQPSFPVQIVWESMGWHASCAGATGSLNYREGMTLGEVIQHFWEWEGYQFGDRKRKRSKTAQQGAYAEPVTTYLSQRGRW